MNPAGDRHSILSIQPEWVLEDEAMGSKQKHWAEKMAAEIAKELETLHAKVELALFDGVQGSATESFARNGRELYHGNQVLAGQLLGYDPAKKFRQSSHTLANIFAALDRVFRRPESATAAKQRIADYLVLDALIGNTDRHHENWGILVKRTLAGRPGIIAPSFDHASSLGRELLDDTPGKCRVRILKEKRIGAYAENAPGAIYWEESDKRGISPLELVRRAAHLQPGLFHGALASLDKLEKATLQRIAGRVLRLDERCRARVRGGVDVLQPEPVAKDRVMTDRTLFLAWQDKRMTRAWFPVGRLDVLSTPRSYRFRYTQGAERARESAGFEPLLDFPDWKTSYESSDLFPLFQNRVISPERKDFSEYLRMLDLPQTAEPAEILEVGGGYRATDNFAVFPKIERRADGSFRCRFFVHGMRYTAAAALERAERLQPGEPLHVAMELTNPATTLAVQLQTLDYHMIGWAPRFLVDDLMRAMAHAPLSHAARVVRLNPPPAPSKQRLLVELSGSWPEYEPMSSGDFEPLTQ